MIPNEDEIFDVWRRYRHYSLHGRILSGKIYGVVIHHWVCARPPPCRARALCHITRNVRVMSHDAIARDVTLRAEKVVRMMSHNAQSARDVT